MGKCLKESAKSRDYQDIGEQAFGLKGRLLASTFVYMEIFLALVSYTISLSDNLSTIFTGTHISIPGLHLSTSQILTVIAVLVAVPSLWLRDLSSISFLSTGGILMSLLIFATVVCTAAFGGVDANQSIPLLNLHMIPGISGLCLQLCWPHCLPQHKRGNEGPIKIHQGTSYIPASFSYKIVKL